MSHRTLRDVIPSMPHLPGRSPSDGIDDQGIPRWFLPALLAAVALLYVATLRPGHAWHDDFALYVLHARNLVEGLPYGSTGYIYNPGNPWHSPGVYPPGFPLLLAPVYAMFGPHLFALKLVVVGSFVAAVAVFALLVRPLLPPRYFLAVMLLVSLQPFFARFKNLLLPDYSFLLFAFLSLYLLRRLYDTEESAPRIWWIAIAAGLCMAGAFAVRAVGVALFAGLALYQVLQLRLPRSPVVLAGVTALALVAIQFLLMPSESGYAAQLADVAGRESPPLYMLLRWRVEGIVESIGALWAPRDDLAIGPMTAVESLVLKGLTVVTVVFAGSGLLTRFRRITLLETFVIAYCAVIFYWSFISARYLIPLIPFLLFYSVVAVRFVLQRGGARVRYAMVALGLIVSASYIANLSQLQTSGFAEDVTDDRALQLFAYLRSCTEDVRLVAERPRAIALFTGRQATSLNRSQLQPERFFEMVNSMGLDYMVTFRGSSTDSAAAPIPGLRPTFENDGFIVYDIPGNDRRSACPAT